VGLLRRGGESLEPTENAAGAGEDSGFGSESLLSAVEPYRFTRSLPEDGLLGDPGLA
jgi:hypothetical protein